MIGMAVVAILMCINFVSCSDDDDYAKMIVGTWYISDWNETFIFEEGGVLKWEKEFYGTNRAKGSWTILDDQLSYKLTHSVASGIIIQTRTSTIMELSSTKMVTNNAKDGTVVYTRK